MADNKVEIVLSAVDQTGAALSSVNAGLGKLSSVASSIAPALATAFSGAGIAAMAKSAIDAADALNDLSQKTGISVSGLSAYKLAAEQSGTSLEAVAKGMRTLSTEVAKNGDAFKKIGIDTGDLDKAMGQIADIFAAMPDGMEKSALATELFGKKVGPDLIPLLNLGAAGLKKSSEAAKQYGDIMQAMAPAADQFKDTLNEISLNSSAAAASFASQLLPTLNLLADEMLDASKNSDAFKTAGAGLNQVLIGLVATGAVVASTFSGIGKTIGAAAAQMVALGTGNIKGIRTIGDEWAADMSKVKGDLDGFLLKLGQPVDIKATKSLSDTGEAAKKAKIAVDTLLKGVKTGAAAAKPAVDELAQVLNKLNAKDSGLDSSYWKDLDTLFKGYQKGRLSVEEYSEAVGKLTSQQKFAVDATNEAKKAEESYQRAMEKSRTEIDRYITSIEDKATALESELSNYGKTKAEIEATTIARLEEQRTIASGFDSQEELVANLDREIAARQRAQAAMQGIEASDVARKAAEDSAKAWEKFADQIEQSLTDSLYRAFESGESFGEAFAKSLENTFKAMVLKFAVQMVVGTGGNLVASVADSVLGTSFSKSGGGGSGSSLLSGASNLSTAYSWGSTAADLAFGSSSGSLIPWLTGASAVAPSSVIAANAVGAAGGDAIGALISAEGWSSATAAGASAAAVGAEAGAAAAAAGAEGAAAGAATAAAAEGAGMTAAAAIPYVGWVIAAVAAVAALGGSGPKEYTGATALSGAYADKDFYGWSGADWKRDGGWFSSDSSGTKFEMVNASTEAFFEKLYGATAQGFIDLGKSLGDTSVEELLKGFSTTISARSEYGAFYEIAEQVSGQLSAAMAKFVMPVVGDVMARTGLTDAGQAMTLVLQQVQVVRNALDLIGKTEHTGVHDSTLAFMAGVADRIVLLFGSVDNLNSAVGTYYQQYFSATEQSDKAREAINASLAALNLPVVETKDQFRGLVDSLDLATIAGQDAFKALMDLAPAFAAMADAATAAQAQILQARQGWQNKLDVLTGTTTERQLSLQADLASTTDATTQALIRQVYAQEDLNAAATAAAQKAAAVAAERYGLETALLQAQGDTAALRARELAGLDASNRVLQEQIYTLTDLAQAAQAAAVVAQQRLGLESQLLQLQGNTGELRARELAALDESNRALQEQIWAIQDASAAAAAASAAAEEQARAQEAARQAAEQAAQQAAQAAAAISAERLGLQKQLWQLEGDTVALRAAELEALDASNRALQEQIWALEDQAAAAAKAAQVEAERLGLQKQLWQLQGNTNALRAAELAVLSPANRALQVQIWALQDSKTAADEWTRAWENLSNTLREQARKLRGDVAGSSSAALLAQFATDTAAARAGDEKAAGRLSSLSADVLSAYAATASSNLDIVRMGASLAASLEKTADTIDATSPTAGQNEELVANEVRGLRDDGRIQSAALAGLLAKLANLTERWERDGLPPAREEIL